MPNITKKLSMRNGNFDENIKYAKMATLTKKLSMRNGELDENVKYAKWRPGAGSNIGPTCGLIIRYTM